MDKIVLVGYSGHSYVICDILQSQNQYMLGYCDNEKKVNNPFKLAYFGRESSEDGLIAIKNNKYFIAIGDNKIRRNIFRYITSQGVNNTINAIHTKSTIGSLVTLRENVMVAPGVVINALSEIGNGVICNTSCVIEHECKINDFVHIAPGAVLCGNVHIGENSFIGANSVVKQGITVGKNVIVGAGSVVVKDIPNNVVVAGNPAKIIKIITE